MVEPDFSFKTQPASLARRKETALAPRGKLSVKLISARHLSAPSSATRPYVVVTFDQNEFVSREPIHEEGEEVTGVAILKDVKEEAVAPPDAGGGPANGVNGAAEGGEKVAPAVATSPYAGSGIGRSLDAYKNGGGGGSPTPATASGAPATDLGSVTEDEATAGASTDDSLLCLSAYNPTWKHEVFL